jgi:hypothetical protein
MPASLASIDSLSISSRNSSLSGGQLNALIQRRTALRSQMAAVEQILTALPPSTTAGSGSNNGAAAPSIAATLPVTSVKLAAMPGKPAPPPFVPVPPRESTVVLAPRANLPTPSYDDALPGAMRLGCYAFWPKRLPANQSRAVQRTLASRREAIKLNTAAARQARW